MYTSAFTFAKGAFDDAFYALDAEIAQLAKSISGYLGEEAWENPSTGLIANVYCWESMEALQTLLRHSVHIAAKQGQAQRLKRYQVVIAEVVRVYGDGGITHRSPTCLHRVRVDSFRIIDPASDQHDSIADYPYQITYSLCHSSLF